ncbi:hypothetical protein [Secundilactobacillus paracollinoides]|nr:hypothetical protein [Secundilactobacillus paracollinoides]
METLGFGIIVLIVVVTMLAGGIYVRYQKGDVKREFKNFTDDFFGTQGK